MPDVGCWGILNGVDERTWNPARDPHLVSPYSMRRLAHKAPSAALRRDQMNRLSERATRQDAG